MSYLPKATQAKPSGERRGPFEAVDGAVLHIAEIDADDREVYRAANHPVVQENGMDIEPDEDYLVGPDKIVSTISLDEHAGDSRGNMNNAFERRKATDRVRGAVALHLLELSQKNPELTEEDIFTNYQLFEADIAPLVEKYYEYGFEDIYDDAYHSRGQQRAVFLIDQDSKKYVVKIPRAKGQRHQKRTREEVAAAIRVKDVEGYERVVAASETGITMFEYIPGSDMARISLEDLQQITPEQIAQYAQMIVEGHKKGIAIDPKPANVIYEAEKGFTIIDYGLIEGTGEDYQSSPAEALMWGMNPLLQARFGDVHRSDDHKDSEQISEAAKIIVPLIEAYIDSAEQLTGQRFSDQFSDNMAKSLALLRREAYDMEGLQRERNESNRIWKEASRNYDDSKHETVDDIF